METIAIMTGIVRVVPVQMVMTNLAQGRFAVLDQTISFGIGAIINIIVHTNQLGVCVVARLLNARMGILVWAIDA